MQNIFHNIRLLKNKIFTSGQKHRERIGTAVSKHRKTSKTNQNSKSYPKKNEGWASNSWTQFTIDLTHSEHNFQYLGHNFHDLKS